jgi:hypothetical protein
VFVRLRDLFLDAVLGGALEVDALALHLLLAVADGVWRMAASRLMTRPAPWQVLPQDKSASMPPRARIFLRENSLCTMPMSLPLRRSGSTLPINDPETSAGMRALELP